MYCESCGAQISENARFCAACGKPIPAPAQPSEPTRGFRPLTAAQPDAQPTVQIRPPQPAAPNEPPVQQPQPELIDPVPAQFPEEPPKRKGRAWVPIAVLAAVAAALTAFFVFVYPIIKEKEPSATEPAETAATEQTTLQANATTAEPTTEPVSGGGDTVPAAPADAKYAPGSYRNTAISEINLRESPSRTANKVGEVRVGETAVITEVYEDVSAGSKERWWGKTTVHGATGWVALYYMSCTDLKDTVLDNAQIPAVLEKLKGYWNTQDGKRFFAVEQDPEAYRILVGPWYSTVDYVAFCTAPVRGDLNSLISIHLYYPGSDGEIPLPAIDGEILLDVSEIENGRLVWSNGGVWEECVYAGATADDAMPPLTE